MDKASSNLSRAGSAEKILLAAILLLQIVILWRMFDPAMGHLPIGGGAPPQPTPSLEPSAEVPPSLDSSALDVPSPFLYPDSDTPAPDPLPAVSFPAFPMRPAFPSFPAFPSGLSRMARRLDAEIQSLFDDDTAAFPAAPSRPALSLTQLPDRYVLALDRVDPDTLDLSLHSRVLTVRSSRRDDHSAYALSSRFLLPGPVAPGATPSVTTADGRVYVTILKPNAASDAAQEPTPGALP